MSGDRELDAGLEMDELIAERVLGWTKQYSPDPTIYAWERLDGGRVTVVQFATFKFSTRDAAALELFKQLNIFDEHALVRGHNKWVVQRWSHKRDMFLFVEEGPTIALAICRAALKALGVEA